MLRFCINKGRANYLIEFVGYDRGRHLWFTLKSAGWVNLSGFGLEFSLFIRRSDVK